MPRFKTQKKKSKKPGEKRGRKPLPTNLHVINGNPSKLNLEERAKNEVKFKPIAPTPPDWLDEIALEEWNRLAPELDKNGLLTGPDRAMFASYCYYYSEFVRVSKELERVSDLTFETETGYKQQHPLVGVRNKAFEKMKSIASEFGFTPSSRVGLQLEKGEEDDGEDLLSG